MASLLLSNKISVEPRTGDKLFYDQYRYSLSFRLERCSTLRDLPDNIETAYQTIKDRLAWRQRVYNPGGNWNSTRQTEAENQIALDRLIEFVNCIHPARAQLHLVVSVDWGYVYTNDLDILNKIASLPCIMSPQAKEAVIDRPRNSLVLRESAHANRSYFKERWISTDTRIALRNFLSVQEDIKLGPSFKTMLNDAGRPTRLRSLLARHHFFDHNGGKIPFMLELVAPGLIRCTVSVLTK
jgi:hypothetical protein